MEATGSGHDESIVSPRTGVATGRVISTDPVVTVSKHLTEFPAGLPGACPEVFAGTKALHLLGFSWSYDRPEKIAKLAEIYAKITGKLPDNSFVFLANTESESYRLSIEGLPNVLANELIFVDERRYAPSLSVDRDVPFDAIYNARFSRFKRHHLAAGIERLLLVYDHVAPYDEDYFEEMRQLLPKAVFHNHLAGQGAYRKMSPESVNDLINQARVGLCLSAEEGAMRASIEYALCGLPIVSTQSVGGRDRYFVGPHVFLAENNPDSVAAGVEHMIRQRFDKGRVRAHVAHMLSFDRHNFLITVNKLAKLLLGKSDAFTSFEPFVGGPLEWVPVRDALGALASRLPGD